MTDPDEAIPHSNPADAFEQKIPVSDDPHDEEDYPRADDEDEGLA